MISYIFNSASELVPTKFISLAKGSDVLIIFILNLKSQDGRKNVVIVKNYLGSALVVQINLVFKALYI